MLSRAGPAFVGGIAVVALCLSSSSTHGAPWLKLDRATAEPSLFPDMVRLRVFVSAVTLQGETIPLFGAKAWQVQLGGSKRSLPYLAGNYENAASELAIMFVIETAFEYATVFPRIADAVRAFIDALPKNARVGVLGYSEETYGRARLFSKRRANEAVDDLDPEALLTDLALIDAVSKGVNALRVAKPTKRNPLPLRRMLIVISDGADSEPDPERYRKVAKRADRAGIRIHALAHSPQRRRAPMLGLGELTKRSHGTFRLVLHTEESFGVNLRQLREEISNQYVLTYFLPQEMVRTKRLKMLASDLISNELKLGKVMCGRTTCSSLHYCHNYECVAMKASAGGSVWRWILYIVGGSVTLLFMLVGIGFLLTRRQQKHAAAQADVAAQTSSATSHHIVPQGPQGGRVEPGGSTAAHRVARPSVHHSAPVNHIAPTGARSGAMNVPTGVAVLLVVKGTGQGQRLPLRHGFTVGKAAGCDMVLTSDGYASGHHAQFHMDAAGVWTLVDQQSTNGTFVNGVRCQTMRLSHGMLIRIGATEVRFLTG